MVKQPLDQVDKNYSSFKAIKLSSTITDENFKILSEAAQNYVDDHEEECGVVPRLFKNENWKRLTNDFVETSDIVPTLFGDTRDGFNPEIGLVWPEDKSDILFLTFALLKCHSVKRLTPKKRKSIAESEGTASPSPKKKTSLASPLATTNFGKLAEMAKDASEITTDESEKPVPNTTKKREESTKAGSVAPSKKTSDKETGKVSPEAVAESIEDESDLIIVEYPKNGSKGPRGKFKAINVDAESKDPTKTMTKTGVSTSKLPIIEEGGTDNGVTAAQNGTLQLQSAMGCGPETESSLQANIKLQFKVLIKGENAGFFSIKAAEATKFSNVVGAALLNARNPRTREDVACAFHCRVSAPKAEAAGDELAAEAWNVDLYSGQHDKEWAECMNKIGTLAEGAQIHADFLMGGR